MNALHKRTAKYRVLGLVVIVLSLFAMSFSILLLQEQTQLATRAFMNQTK